MRRGEGKSQNACNPGRRSFGRGKRNRRSSRLHRHRPLALDNAVSPEAARHKGITDPNAGHADILLVPNIETGNVFYKSMVFMAKSQNAGLIVGAKAPVIVTSRADSEQTKLNSIALALAVAATNL